METESKYKKYTVEDFVQDKDFRDWVLSPNEIRNSFWTGFQDNNPEEVETIRLARQIVEALIIKEEPLNSNDYQQSLHYLTTYLQEKTNRKKLILRVVNGWSKVAAVLVVPLLITSIYLFSDYKLPNRFSGQMIKYIVPEGQKSNLELADGTKVWLNSGTTLIVPANGQMNERKVQLSGEAYFDVAKNKQIPFLVETRDYTIKVYGTSFNVCAYNHQKTSETTLKEGSISVITKTNKEIKLSPGQKIDFDNDKNFTMSKVDPALYSCWKDNVLKIDNENLKDLIVRMEHWYGVKIGVNDFEKMKDLRYTLTIKTESLKEMLEMMNYAIPFKYTIKGENVTLNYNVN